MTKKSKHTVEEKSNEVKRPDGQVVVEKPEREIGGRKDQLDPVRYGDWEKNGRCIDF